MNISLRLAWRNLWRQPRRTWLTTGAMIFSNTILVFMVSLQFGMYGLMIDNTLAVFTGHLQVQAPGYKDDKKMRQSIPDVAALAAKIRNDSGFEAVAARATAFALASSAERSFGVQVIGIEPEFESQVSTLPGLLRDGRYPTDRQAAEVVIGSVLARNLKVATGDELTLLGSGRDGSFAATVVQVVGIFDTGMAAIDRNFVQLPLGTFQEVFTMGTAGHEIVIRMSDLAEVADARPRLESLLPGDGSLLVFDWDELQPSLKQAIQADLAGAWFMYGVLIVLVAFSVLNTVLMSVLERTREFGIVMALGLTPGRLGRLVLLETALMSAIGFAGGILLGAALILWFGAHGFSYPGMDEMADRFNMPARIYPQLQWLPLFLGPVIVFIGAMLASLYPAARLRWLQPVQAMRAV
jgi:ABC-type lipoprotein release transport system permease subunit